MEPHSIAELAITPDQQHIASLLMKTILLNLLIISCSLLLLNACKIDGEEEITLRSDGSGDIRVHFILPYKAFSKEEATQVHHLLEEISTRHDGISILENTSCPYGDYCQALKLHINFESALDLERIILSEKSYFEKNTELSATDEKSLDLISALLGTIDEGIQPWGIDYQRELDLSPLFKGQINNGAILGDAEFRYILNTPLSPDSHNAGMLDASSGKLVWKVPLKTYFNKPFVLQASYARSASQILWFSALVIASTLVFWLYKRLRSRRDHHR